MDSVAVCRIRGAEIRIHPLLIVVAAGACVLGRLDELLQAFVALSLHEACHAITARAFGCRIQSIDVMPFGGVARLDRREMTLQAEWSIAIAGPVSSFIIAGLIALFCNASPYTAARLEPFLRFNLMLGVINLLPALPLDGGRVAKCLLQERAGLSLSVRITAWSGVAIGALMLIGFAVAVLYRVYNLTLPVMGVFLLIAAVRELRGLPEQRLYALGRRGEELMRGDGVRVQMFAAHASMRASEALSLLRENRFNVLRVVDDEMHTLGELDETALLCGMARHGSRASVGTLLRFDRPGKVC